MTISWTEDLKTGMEVIDGHHESMVERMNDLLTTFEHGYDKENVTMRIVLFESFLISHFALEESLQKKLDFPYYTSHSDEHLRLAQDFSGLRRLVKREDLADNLSAVAKDFIRAWWKTYLAHIHTADRKLAAFLKTRF